jgi:hypothetical protein
MEARNRTLPDWLTRIRTRQIKLPRFQRFEAWTHHTVTALLNTVLQELPAGAVLILEVGEEEPFISRTVIGAPETGERVIEHLLDGQQRLTALWRSLTDNYPDRSYFVRLEQDEETGAPYYATSRARWMKDGNKYPLKLNDPVELWKEKLIPVSLLRPDAEAEAALTVWAMKAAENDMTLVLEIIQKVNGLRALFAKFNIPFLSLPSTTSKETALNVFIQMNTSATPLSAYDIVVAQVEAGTEMSLHDLVADLKATAPDTEAYVRPPDVMLSASALLLEKVPTQTNFISKGFSDSLVENWETTKLGISKTIQFLEQERILDAKRLPTDVVIAPLAALWGISPQGLDAEGEARTILRKYLWRACFTDRYERTSATRALADFRELKSLLEGNKEAKPLIFNEEEWPLPTVEQLILAGWPTKKDRLPRALLALSLRSGGYDLADGTPASREHLKEREYHHLFPVARLKEQGKTDSEIYRALNCALVTWKTNRNISAKTPEKYLAERREGTSLGEDEVRRRLESHLVPYDELVSATYEEFLLERAKRMHAMMVRLCAGESV